MLHPFSLTKGVVLETQKQKSSGFLTKYLFGLYISGKGGDKGRNIRPSLKTIFNFFFPEITHKAALNWSCS